MGEQIFTADERVDLERLFELARQKSKAGRTTLYRNIWDLFENRGRSLTEEERRLMIEILRQLSHEIEMAVRVQLAEQLAKSKNANHDLAVMLANDAIEVAYPILLECDVLKDVDLIEVVKQRMQQHRLAVAIRANINEDVCRALADSQDQVVITAMLSNPTARIGEELLGELSQRSRFDDGLHAPVLHRAELPRALAERMYFWVSAALRRHIGERFSIDVDSLDRGIAAAVEATLAADQDSDPKTASAQRLVDKLYDAGELSPTFLIKSLREGQTGLFELAFAKLAGLRPILMRRILYEPGGEALSVVCRALGIDRAVFLSIFHMTRHARRDLGLDEPFAPKLKRFFDGLLPDNARRILDKWRRDPAFLAALMQVGVQR
jgi:uncharacterized protein (DUF2336 family)